MLFLFRAFFVKPAVAWTIWNLMLLFLALSMTDPNFFAIVAKPDNVPIVALVFLLAFFTWLATYRAVKNDDRIEHGEPPLEKLDDEKVLVWPDLVYTELICMIALTALLIFWAIWLQAPLEEPASSVKTPNPSKAPWYFLGLQEMLVYYDPWMAGVVLPSMIIVGLMAIPYIDFNKQGNGYYTINERKFAYITFQFGFLELWVTLIVLGTLLRGPNWNFFGPYELWDAHKVEALNNVNLSEYFWQSWLGQSLPKAPPNAELVAQLGLHPHARVAGHPAGAGVFHRAAAADGDHGVPQVLSAHGLHPLHGDDQPAAVHDGAADQDGAALEHQFEVHHRDPGIFFELLRFIECGASSAANCLVCRTMPATEKTWRDQMGMHVIFGVLGAGDARGHDLDAGQGSHPRVAGDGAGESEQGSLDRDGDAESGVGGLAFDSRTIASRISRGQGGAR